MGYRSLRTLYDQRRCVLRDLYPTRSWQFVKDVAAAEALRRASSLVKSAQQGLCRRRNGFRNNMDMKGWAILVVVTGIFWNLENFFDFNPDGTSASEMEFSAAGARHWTKSRFYTKCNAVGKTVLALSDRTGTIPDFVGVAEVENAFVLRSLARNSPLRKMEYGWVHYDSPDKRGIDCGLLYRKNRLELLESKPCHLRDNAGRILATRDILLALFRVRDGGDTLAVLVNHHPSKLGGTSSGARGIAMARLDAVCDSLQNSGIGHIVAVGDFNDNLWGTAGSGAGTIKYNGAWEKIDGCFARGCELSEGVFDFAPLLAEDAGYGGMKPLRTYSGPRYLGGVSDHLPIFLSISY